MWRVIRRALPLASVVGLYTYQMDYQRAVRTHVPAFSTVTYPANSPIEDRISASHLSSPSATIASVFDGHGGWQISNFLHDHINSAFTAAFQKTSGDAKGRVEAALKAAYDELENKIVDMAKESYRIGFGEVASTGSCAITAVVFPSFYVIANTGDCQAILVSHKDNTAVGRNLCPVHSSNEPHEQAKLRAAHPNESDIVVCRHPKACYVKQRLMPTRSFGDLDLKWPEFNNPQQLPRDQGYRAPKKTFTPPYISHRPDVLVFDIHPEDKFLILASDGLWDELSEHTVASIVASTNDPKEAADLLLEAALTNAAKNAHMTPSQLKALTSGRRRLHDDISIAVLLLKKP